MTDWNAIAAAIGSATQQPFRFSGQSTIGGGCINEAYRIVGQDGRQFFIKLNSADKATMFAAEAAGLNEIATTQTIRVPQVISHGVAGKQSYLILEYLELGSRGDAKLLGKQLAALHRCTPPSPPPLRGRAREGVEVCENKVSTLTPTLSLQGRGGSGAPSHFGFDHDNFLGTTSQPNAWKDNWIDFWREHRLGFQLRLSAENGYGGQLQRLGEKLLDALPAFFDNYTPQPSLLHGDLWSSNHGFLADGTPVIFDPATYYGDRECDLAMTELFGGYSADFYAAYRAAYPLDAGYVTRSELYNIYHILNHANLFGGGYARQVEGMMQRLLVGITS